MSATGSTWPVQRASTVQATRRISMGWGATSAAPGPSTATDSGSGSLARHTSNCNVNGHFSIQNHTFQGCFLHSFCTFNRKAKNRWPYILQFAVPITPPLASKSTPPLFYNRKYSLRNIRARRKQSLRNLRAAGGGVSCGGCGVCVFDFENDSLPPPAHALQPRTRLSYLRAQHAISEFSTGNRKDHNAKRALLHSVKIYFPESLGRRTTY